MSAAPPAAACARGNFAPAIAMVAGETSGDLLAGLLLEGMRVRWPAFTACGIGGAQMKNRGFIPWWPSEKLAVRGYVEVLRHYREITGIRRQLKARLLQRRPDLFIGVDAPDFNLDLEHDLKQSGIKTVHFVSPSIWAWRADRLAKICASVDHMLCIFPFEPALLRAHGVAATYVGHPLAGVIPMQADKRGARLALGLTEDEHVIAILPGSRASEIAYLAKRFFDAAVVLQRSRPTLKFVVPVIAALRAPIERAMHDAGLSRNVQLLAGQSHTALAACDVALVASGTATLEAALYKRPMVIAYNMHWLSWQIMRRKRMQPWVGLPNILCGEFVVPELLQEAVAPAALAQAVGSWLEDPQRVMQLQLRFMKLHKELLRDTPRLATDAIQQVLEA